MSKRKKGKMEQKHWTRIEEGVRCFYGVIVGVWEDDHPTHQWVLIQNDDEFLHPKNTYTLYKFRSEINNGEFILSHFIPEKVIKAMQGLELREDVSPAKESIEVKTNVDTPVKSDKPRKKESVVSDEVVEVVEDTAIVVEENVSEVTGNFFAIKNI